MVVFRQEKEANKVVVLYDSKKKYWFLPKGRKDVEESLEQTALRETYEESGYRVEFFPVHSRTNAPGPPSDLNAPNRRNHEPIKITTFSYAEHQHQVHNYIVPAGEYICLWYIGWVQEDAVQEEGTGMENERNFSTTFLTVRDAMLKLQPDEAEVVKYADELYRYTTRRLSKEDERHQTESGGATFPTNHTTTCISVARRLGRIKQPFLLDSKIQNINLSLVLGEIAAEVRVFNGGTPRSGKIRMQASTTLGKIKFVVHSPQLRAPLSVSVSIGVGQLTLLLPRSFHGPLDISAPLVGGVTLSKDLRAASTKLGNRCFFVGKAKSGEGPEAVWAGDEADVEAMIGTIYVGYVDEDEKKR